MGRYLDCLQVPSTLTLTLQSSSDVDMFGLNRNIPTEGLGSNPTLVEVFGLGPLTRMKTHRKNVTSRAARIMLPKNGTNKSYSSIHRLRKENHFQKDSVEF